MVGLLFFYSLSNFWTSKKLEMDYGHKQPSSFFVLVKTDFSYIFGRYTLFLHANARTLVSRYQKRERIEKLILFYWNSLIIQTPLLPCVDSVISSTSANV